MQTSCRHVGESRSCPITYISFSGCLIAGTGCESTSRYHIVKLISFIFDRYFYGEQNSRQCLTLEDCKLVWNIRLSWRVEMSIYRVQCMILMQIFMIQCLKKKSVDINKLCKVSTRQQVEKSNTLRIATCNIRNTGWIWFLLFKYVRYLQLYDDSKCWKIATS